MYLPPFEKNCPTNIMVSKHINDNWSIDLFDIEEYGIQNIKGLEKLISITTVTPQNIVGACCTKK